MQLPWRTGCCRGLFVESAQTEQNLMTCVHKRLEGEGGGRVGELTSHIQRQADDAMVLAKERKQALQ